MGFDFLLLNAVEKNCILWINKVNKNLMQKFKNECKWFCRKTQRLLQQTKDFITQASNSVCDCMKHVLNDVYTVYTWTMLMKKLEV